MQHLVQEVAPDHNDAPDHEEDIHERICGSLVKIVFYNPSKEKILFVVTGVVVISEVNYCHIIALWPAMRLLWHKTSFVCEINFPDGTTMALARETIKIKGGLAAFTVQTEATVNAVTFSDEEVSDNDTVYAVGFRLYLGSAKKEIEVVTSHRSPGFVMHKRSDYFTHDCPPVVETYNGDSVFNKKNHFVGITFKDRGVAVALSIRRITIILAGFHEGMENQPLSAIPQ